MGTLTDVFAARPADAAVYRVVRLLELATKKNSYAALQVRGITPVELGLLWSLLERKRWSAQRYGFLSQEQVALDDPSLPRSVRKALCNLFEVMEIASAGNFSRDRSALFLFPEKFVDLLASIESKSLVDIANRWRRQLARRKVARWSDSFAIKILRAVSSRAKKVKRRGPQLYLWLSP
jgi:hypothetical protein